ncbi:UDP-4-amino-4,6-dideoxy-N-acetyl-beta-L-altrosamine transaminase [Geoalkalibacter halelectricus]|uniref:UDP-4-amino-4, 6-dideoxy-N-acetyl-beta-L-altrosamine transaminase n=1 Tax=Geoalkalibacter halelectricus TaxID=2847045 RepID=A0ABY5ZWE6_9BACT|nr:UDP-4-amino-4,6-dideoxy-N-acetyl-beta-L-altrosamine transaminase [Geoalkalibacter halelectricus]MDO3377981.1 UDP-4-amino-4,6-dideoxy-N-acetyl-beta-L-altrosamine transaminase [Geoalkalibacter halelectricus]UWZ81516.1 UDP-4-amino-4,6-dideoxy-N-acetyl-beta-L-altrosamine transaminase [Geoalkalibacter halelectricus]
MKFAPIPYGRQEITADDIEAVQAVLQSDFLTQGPVVEAFEQAISGYCRAGYGVATNSATSALHLACLALELGPGDWLWTSPITFVASANCGLYCGAKVDFVDINPQNYNLCPQALESKLKDAKQQGRLPKVVVAVHLAGHPCDMRAIHALSEQYGFRIIEDASHAVGAYVLNEPVGSGRFSDITVFSFHPVKIITTGEGGIALTNNPDWARRMRLLRSHGVTRDPDCMDQAPDGPWYYQQVDLGFNYRMTDFQAALGLSQLQRLDEFVSRRQELAKRYSRLLAHLPVTLPQFNPETRSACHLYIIRLQLDQILVSHRAVFEELRTQGIGVNLHYIPVHTQPYYRTMGFAPGDFPQAEKYYTEAMSLPLFPGMSDQQQDRVVTALQKALTL